MAGEDPKHVAPALEPDAARENIGAGPGAQGMTLDEWQAKKNEGPGPAVSGLLQVPLQMEPPVPRHQLESFKLPGLPEYMPATLIKGVLSKEECEALIQAVPQEGTGYFDTETISKLYEDRVVSYRYLTDDKHLADVFTHRLRDFLPCELDGGKLLRINPAWRFVKYDEGGHQTAHIDGREPANARETEDGRWIQSRLTVQVYLNDGYDGGELAFVMKEGEDLSLKDHRIEGEQKEQLRETYVLKPTLGDVVLFYQERLLPPTKYPPYNLLHEARDVISGTKHACRTMVDYVFPTQETAQLSNLKDDIMEAGTRAARED